MRNVIVILILLIITGCVIPEKVIPPDGMRYLGKNEQGCYKFENIKDGSVLIFIGPGAFIMGIKDNPPTPVHRVSLSVYMIGKYEVTNEQYKKFCDETGRPYLPDPEFVEMKDYFLKYPDHPVVNISWYDAKAYCDWAGLKLPTEAQWEKGAGGTDEREYPWGNHDPYYNGSHYANYDPGDNDADGYKYTSPVGSYETGRSPYGLMDMAGNVWEWCNDWYDSDYYSRSPSSNPTGPSSGESKVLRGGSCYSIDNIIRCAYRGVNTPSSHGNLLGFRPAAY